jgi:hypothetical protein
MAMKENRRGFDDTKIEPTSRANINPLATETAALRALEAFTQATRKAGKGAHDAGIALTGRIRGKRVRVAPDGRITEVPESK